MEESPNTGGLAQGGRHRRRSFLTRTLGLGAAAFGAATAGSPRQAMAAGVNDGDILNFALNLEYLEAEYYTYAVTGKGIDALGIGTTGSGVRGPVTIKPNPKVPFAIPAIQQYANEVAIDEQRHVVAIRATLAAFGIQPVAKPAIDLLNSFNTLAQVAGLGSTFDPFASDVAFLLGAYIFEDVGVTAYHGAAGLVRNKDILGAAAGILAVEAYHAGLIRTVLFAQNQGAPTQAISDVRLALGGSVDYGVADGPGGTSSIVVADGNSIAGTRTFRQVLNIVYGGVNATRGLFFPGGMNGTIR